MKLIHKKYFTTVALTWAGCFVLFFFVYMFVLTPQRNSKEELEKQLAEKKQTYDSALEATCEETRVRLKEQIKHLRNKLCDFVVSPEDLVNLTFDISQIADEKRLSSFSIGAKEERYRSSEVLERNYIRENRIYVSFAAADFNQFAGFLNALERHRPTVFVDKFTITRSDNNNSGHDVDMNLSVFVRKRRDG